MSEELDERFYGTLPLRIKVEEACRSKANRVSAVLIKYFKSWLGKDILNEDMTLISEISSELKSIYELHKTSVDGVVTTVRNDPGRSYLLFVVESQLHGKHGITCATNVVSVGRTRGTTLSQVDNYIPIKEKFSQSEVVAKIENARRLRNEARRAALAAHPFGEYI